ncbi:MAG TPA: hypothetical protein VF820_06275 [Patescibacteria group bacterium]
MNKVDEKHFEHIAAMQAITDYSWHSWNSPIGLALGLIGIVVFLNGFVVLAILIKFIFLMK